MRRIPVEPAPAHMPLDERACAHHRTVVFLRQAYPNMALMTYDSAEHRGAEHLILLKLVVGVGEGEPRWLTYDACDDATTADNVTGGLRSVAVTGDGMRIVSEIYPLLVGRDTDEAEGAALVRVRCDGGGPLWLKFGCGSLSFMHYSPNREMAGEGIDCAGGDAWVEGDTAYVTRRGSPVVTAVRGSFRFERRQLEGAVEGCGGYVVASAGGGEACLVAGFSMDGERAAALAGLDPEAEYRKIKRTYEEKLDRWMVDTPSPALNQAFAHALLNVEYSWLKPLGWIESIHHWPTMWHMEQTAADEWAGNPDRTRDCLRSQMRNLFESGAVPDMCTTGRGRRDWGGNNQFFFREVDHYLKMTGDTAFAREAEPTMHRILDQTFREYDPTGSGLLSWGTQIGNQEDFECTPGAGAATGSEGVRMLEIMADFKRYLGKAEEADAYRARAAAALAALKKALWLNDLGRYGWYRDVRGEPRLDTTYHGIAYPVLYDQVDDADKASSMDHLLHRLTGPEGEVYQSNHFGDHAYDFVPTWGMQCGSDMQPFAAAALARLGKADEAILPLEFIARRVCGDYQRGSWPETANEKRFAYFSPSAAVFAQAVVESIFGVTMDRMGNRVTVSPCLPTSWDRARMRVNGVSFDYRRRLNKHTFILRLEGCAGMEKVFLWRLPPYRRVEARCGGRKLPVETREACGWFEAKVALPDGEEIALDVDVEPMGLSVAHEPWAACGDEIEVAVGGAELVALYDRCRVFDRYEIRDGTLKATLRADLLDPYEKFGPLGLMNFARRQFVLRLRRGAAEFDWPCHISVVPPAVCRGACEGSRLTVSVANRSKRAFAGALWLRLGSGALKAEGGVPARGESDFVFELGGERALRLSPGKNRAGLVWQPAAAQGPAFACELEIEAGERPVRVVPVPLDERLLKPADYWKEIGWHRSHGHMKQGSDRFMEGLFNEAREIRLLDSVPLALRPEGFLPLSMDRHRVVEIPLRGLKAKKLYILMSAFIDNHDVYSAVFRLELEAEQGDAFLPPVYRKELTFPGELDMGFGDPVIAGFATYVNGTERPGPVAFPGEGHADYPEAAPPLYPQRKHWCVNRAVDVCNTVMNLIEFDIGRFAVLRTLRFIAAEAHSAGGVLAVAAHVEGGEEA